MAAYGRLNNCHPTLDSSGTAALVESGGVSAIIHRSIDDLRPRLHQIKVPRGIHGHRGLSPPQKKTMIRLASQIDPTLQPTRHQTWLKALLPNADGSTLCVHLRSESATTVSGLKFTLSTNGVAIAPTGCTKEPSLVEFVTGLCAVGARSIQANISHECRHIIGPRPHKSKSRLPLPVKFYERRLPLD